MPKEIDQFRILERQALGKGFSSTVLLAQHLPSNALCAIKVVKSKNANKVQQLLLRNQIKALQKITHPNVIKLVKVFSTSDSVCLACQYCENGDLKSMVDKQTRLDQPAARSIFLKIVEGYSAVVQAKVIHRDLKLSNIFMAGTTPKIGDFGFCDHLEGQKIREFYNVGSPAYMSPEAFFDTYYSEKSDIWALGVILHEMVAGRTLLEGDYSKGLQKFKKEGLSHLVGNVSPDLISIMARCLQTDFSKRISTKDLLQKLRHVSQKKSTIRMSEQTTSRVLSPLGKEKIKPSNSKPVSGGLVAIPIAERVISPLAPSKSERSSLKVKPPNLTISQMQHFSPNKNMVGSQTPPPNAQTQRIIPITLTPQNNKPELQRASVRLQPNQAQQLPQKEGPSLKSYLISEQTKLTPITLKKQGQLSPSIASKQLFGSPRKNSEERVKLKVLNTCESGMLPARSIASQQFQIQTLVLKGQIKLTVLLLEFLKRAITSLPLVRSSFLKNQIPLLLVKLINLKLNELKHSENWATVFNRLTFNNLKASPASTPLKEEIKLLDREFQTLYKAARLPTTTDNEIFNCFLFTTSQFNKSVFQITKIVAVKGLDKLGEQLDVRPEQELTAMFRNLLQLYRVVQYFEQRNSLMEMGNFLDKLEKEERGYEALKEIRRSRVVIDDSFKLK